MILEEKGNVYFVTAEECDESPGGQDQVIAAQWPDWPPPDYEPESLLNQSSNVDEDDEVVCIGMVVEGCVGSVSCEVVGLSVRRSERKLRSGWLRSRFRGS